MRAGGHRCFLRDFAGRSRTPPAPGHGRGVARWPPRSVFVTLRQFRGSLDGCGIHLQFVTKTTYHSVLGTRFIANVTARQLDSSASTRFAGGLQFIGARRPLSFDPLGPNQASFFHPVECRIERTFIGAQHIAGPVLSADMMAYPWRTRSAGGFSAPV